MKETGTVGKWPVVFISHGAPTLATEDGAAHRFLREYGRRLGRPQAIVVLSAHFVAPVATVTAAEFPETIHDFGGFPADLYTLRYAAPGDPVLADEIAGLLEHADIPVKASPSRGLDHGAWIPLSLMYPQADIPVVQLSLDPARGAQYHFELGRLLAPLRARGVLIVGSGGITHNLSQLDWQGGEGAAPDWAVSFNEWIADVIAQARVDDLLEYRQRGPSAARNHPTEEHFFPLLCALGASNEQERRVRVHHSYTFGSLSMDTYEFGGCSAMVRVQTKNGSHRTTATAPGGL